MEKDYKCFGIFRISANSLQSYNVENYSVLAAFPTQVDAAKVLLSYEKPEQFEIRPITVTG